MARFSADHFENVTDFLSEHDIEFDPADLADEFADLSRDDFDEMLAIVEANDYEAWQDFCIEHGIKYHG